MSQVVASTIQISASSSNPQQTSIIVTYDEEIENNGLTKMKRKGFRNVFTDLFSNGCRLLEFNKKLCSLITNKEYSIKDFPIPTISTNTTQIHTNPNSVIAIASVGDISGALVGIKNQLLHINGINQTKVNEMTGQSAFIFVFDTTLNKVFFETAPTTCEMVIDINFAGVSKQRVYTDVNLENRVIALESKTAKPSYESEWMFDEKGANRKLEFNHNLNRIPTRIEYLFKPDINSPSVFSIVSWAYDYSGGPVSIEITNSSIIVNFWQNAVCGTWSSGSWTYHTKGYWKIIAWDY